jgi:hypothetical protein
MTTLLKGSGSLGDAFLCHHLGWNSPRGKPCQHLFVGSGFIPECSGLLVGLFILFHRLFLGLMTRSYLFSLSEEKFMSAVEALCVA